MSTYIISSVKPIVGCRLEVVDGIQIDNCIADVKASNEFVNVYYVRFESDNIYVKVIWLQRICDIE